MEPPPGVGPAEDRIRAELRARTLELRAARRRIRALELAREGTDPEEVVTLHDSTREGQAPRVSVCVPLFDHAGHVGAALDSVLAQTAAADLELLVLDDASTDDGAAVVERRLAQAAVPARLLSRRVNAGLPAARNLLLAHARAPYALMLDADNVLFPHAAERLASALDADPAAAFAFGLVGIFRDERPDGLLSHYPWLPEQLPAFNWIDALALLRTRAVLDLGGFATDERLHGWEDYDLWCRVAETGGHGAHVPQPIGRYRRMMGSMVSLSDLDQGGMRELLAARHPRLFGRATAPAETPA
jgi:glycosyltransferase involved in cell wall biosynthesis